MEERRTLASMRKKGKAVRGVVAPGPRLTGWAAVYFTLYVALPILGAALLLDVAFYFVFAAAGRCYGVLCLF